MKGVQRLTAADSTPGTAWMRVSSRSTIAGPSEGAYRDEGGRTQNVSTPPAVNPVRRFWMRLKVSMSAPDPIEQQHRERDFTHHQHAHGPSLAGPAAVVFLQRGRELLARGPDRGHEREDKRGPERNRECKQQHAGVECRHAKRGHAPNSCSQPTGMTGGTVRAYRSIPHMASTVPHAPATAAISSPSVNNC